MPVRGLWSQGTDWYLPGYGQYVYIGLDSHTRISTVKKHKAKQILMTYQSLPSSYENFTLDSHSSTTIAETRRDDVETKPLDQNHDQSTPQQHNQSLSAYSLQSSVTSALEALEAHIDQLKSGANDPGADVASLSIGLHSIRQQALRRCEQISITADEAGAKDSADYLAELDDTEVDDDSSEDSFALVDPPNQEDSIRLSSATYPSDQGIKSSDGSIPDWACTTTAGGCRVPLFWEGADMGYFDWHQEQAKADGGNCR
jgi:hypothetical protein